MGRAARRHLGPGPGSVVAAIAMTAADDLRRVLRRAGRRTSRPARLVAPAPVGVERLQTPLVDNWLLAVSAQAHPASNTIPARRDTALPTPRWWTERLRPRRHLLNRSQGWTSAEERA